MVPSRNFTVRPAPVEAKPMAASTTDAPDTVVSELSVSQSRLNPRRLSARIALTFFSIPFEGSVVVAQRFVLLGWASNFTAAPLTAVPWQAEIADVAPAQ